MREIILLPVFVAAIVCLFFAQNANAISVVYTTPVGNNPYGIAYDSAKKEIFVANTGGNSSVTVINATNGVYLVNILVGSHPTGVAYDPAKGEIFVANSGDVTVSVISDSTNSVVATITGLNSPSDVAYDSVKKEIFVANGYSVSVFSQ